MADAVVLPEIVVTADQPTDLAFQGPPANSVDPPIPNFGAVPFIGQGAAAGQQQLLVPGQVQNIPTQAYQPFIGHSQAKRSRCFCQISINGQNVTNWLEPFLVSVRVRDNAGAFEAWVEVDDRDARLDAPPINGSVDITLGWRGESARRVYHGWILEVEHTFQRKSGGRRMNVHCTGAIMNDLIKTLFDSHQGDGAPPGMIQGQMVSFEAMANYVAGLGGTSTSVGPSFAGMMRDYWTLNHESPMQWHTRMADELGAPYTRLENNHFVFYGVSEQQKTTINAQWGDNLIGWRIKPSVARSLWNHGEQEWFDDKSGKWETVQNDFPQGPQWIASAIAKLPGPAKTPNEAQQQVQGFAYKQPTLNGEGRIIINGEPNAQVWGMVQLRGARPGVDGLYQIFTAEHTYSRQGYVTILEVFPRSIDSFAPSNRVGQRPGVPSVLPAPAPNIQ